MTLLRNVVMPKQSRDFFKIVLPSQSSQSIITLQKFCLWIFQTEVATIKLSNTDIPWFFFVKIWMLLNKEIHPIVLHHIICPNLSSSKCSRIRITYCATCLKCWVVVWVKMCSWASLGVFPLAISPRIWTKLASLKL